MKKFIAGLVCGFALASALVPANSATDKPQVYRDLDRFGNAFEQILASYVHEVDTASLIDAAIGGMLSSLDHQSKYMTAREFTEMQVRASGSIAGIGLNVSSTYGFAKVVSLIANSPAARSEIKPGDYITDIDGHSIHELTLEQVVERLRGPENSQITLTILRQGMGQPLEVTLTRSFVRQEAITYRKEGNVGYIRLNQFDSTVDAQMRKDVADLKKQIGPEIKGYVLDLRNNSGGLLDQVIAVADDFLDDGEIVSLRGRTRPDNMTYKANSGDIADGKPMVVLINEVSASGAEIVAGALQDHHRATIVGAKSVGLGVIQTIIPVGQQGGALRLTTSTYYLPSGRAIEDGIHPDVTVLQEAEVNDRGVCGPLAEAQMAERLSFGPSSGAGAEIFRPSPNTKTDDFQLSYALARINGQ